MRSALGPGIRVVMAVLLLVSGPAPVLSTDAPHPAGSDDSGNGGMRAVERPDHTGPYPNASYMYVQFKGSTKSYYINLKIWYPAQNSTENATPDGSGAPYPVIVQLPFMGGPEEAYNFIAPQIVSWGFISVCIGPNWNDFGNSCNATDINEILDMLERANITPGHNLCGMVEKNFGISGYSSGGGLAVLDAALVDRIRALHANAPAISDSTIDVLAQFFNKPFQFQAGQNDTTYRPHSAHGFSVFPPPKSFLDTKDGSHGGPFYWDCMISFFMRYLKGIEAYDTFLYGWDAMDDVGQLKYLLNFQLQNGSYFPGSIQIKASPVLINISESVDFSATFAGYLPLGHPNGSFQWDFYGDGNADSSDPLDTTATCNYTMSGQWRVGMWYAIGEYRLLCNNSVHITVNNLPPTVRLHDGYSAPEDGILQFIAEASDTPGDNESLQFRWEFGDGPAQPFSPSRNAFHAYSHTGNYTLKVTARDPAGATAAAQAKVTISDLPPTAEAGPDLMAEKDSPVDFTGAGGGTPSDIPALRFRWHFGDGNSSSWSPDANATHTYTRSGNYTADLSVMDDEGTVAVDRLRVLVTNSPPSARTLRPVANSTIEKDVVAVFEGTGTDTESDAPLLQFRWDFGDGTTSNWSSSPVASHAYTRGGNYTVLFQAKDPEGAFGEAGFGLAVRNQPPTVRMLSPWTAEVEEDSMVHFAAEGEDTDSDVDILNYTWDIDGKSYYGAELDIDFTTEGLKEFTVTVRDPEGAVASASGKILVKNRAPRLTITISPLRITENGSVNFSAKVTDTASDLPSISILWDFGDGGNSTAFSGSHLFARPGNYDVTVSVSDDEEAHAEQSVQVVVDPAPPPKPKPPQPRPDDDNGQPFPTGTVAVGASIAALAAMLAVVLLVRKKKK